ncbi:hypothetical protein DCC79_15725 [bacterium]|mgnify:CR=1 FL=1|nr:YIP1 family protein [Chloroflexi bacterium CFX6]RIL05991.1 MAG: hypothetical protein DCC79_15725 [bacterium]
MQAGPLPASDTTPSPVPPAQGRGGPMALAIDTLMRPRAALPRLAERPGRRWILPVALLALVAAVNGFLGARQVIRDSFASMGAAGAVSSVAVGGDTGAVEGVDAASAAMGTASMLGAVFAAVGAVVRVVGGVVLAAAVLHFLGTIFGGQQGFGQMLVVVAWAHLPVLAGSLVRLAYGLVAGFGAVTPGLSGLVDDQSLLGPVLAQVELWTLWLVALLYIGMRVVSRVPRLKAGLAVGALVALWVAVGALGVVASRVFSA